jgi:hypothetical protein
MRRMRFTGAEPIMARAAHSRVIAPGDVVDFDEMIHTAGNDHYTLESTLAGYTDRFEAVPDDEAAADEMTETTEAPSAEVPTTGTSAKAKRPHRGPRRVRRAGDRQATVAVRHTDRDHGVLAAAARGRAAVRDRFRETRSASDVRVAARDRAVDGSRHHRRSRGARGRRGAQVADGRARRFGRSRSLACVFEIGGVALR